MVKPPRSNRGGRPGGHGSGGRRRPPGPIPPSPGGLNVRPGRIPPRGPRNGGASSKKAGKSSSSVRGPVAALVFGISALAVLLVGTPVTLVVYGLVTGS